MRKLLRDSKAAECRYGECAVAVFGADADLIWEHSEADYQGFANILVRCADGRFAHYEWTYGSCTGCDEWEARGLDDDSIEGIMRDAAAWFDDEPTLRRYLKLEDADTTYPCANTATNGSIPGMLRTLAGDVGADFRAMGEAFEEWARPTREAQGG